MRFDKPTGLEKSWREWVRVTGSVIDYQVPCEIHHPAGRTAKQDKLAIGHWFILPLTSEQHKLIDDGAGGLEMLKFYFLDAHDDNHFDVIYDMTLHEFEKFLFTDILLDRLMKPFDDETLTAIQRWHR